MPEALQPILPMLSKPESIDLTELEELLIRKVHSGCQKIIIEKEFDGGFSGTRVFLILPIRLDGSHHARIVTKIGPKATLAREKENYDQNAGPALPFTTAQVQKLQQEDDQAALNYIFAGGEDLGKTISLEEYYSTQTSKKINDTLEVLMETALGSAWYNQSHPLHCPFREEYGRHLPEHERLEEIVKSIFPNLTLVDSKQIQIPNVSGTFPNPLTVYSELLNRTLRGKRSFVHGDLHLRNVLVDKKGKAWLIDFAKVGERHNLFDFIKLETYIRLMALAREDNTFSLSEYAQFEQTLNAATLRPKQALPLPENLQLAKAYAVIIALRKIASKYMGQELDFREEYFPALSLYCLAMLKYYSSNGLVPTQMVFITTCVLDQFILGLEKRPIRPAPKKQMNSKTTTPPKEGQMRYDAFISYSQHDEEWVKTRLLPDLESQGLRICVHYRDFNIGMSILDNMEWAAENSRHTLLVLTPAWVQSEWTNFESILVQTTDPAARKRRLLPLVLKLCEPPSRIRMLTPVYFNNPNEYDTPLKRLIEAIGISPKDKQPEQPKPSQPSIELPETAPYFVGRSKVLNEIKTDLKKNSPSTIIAIVGMGGIGKTALAKKIKADMESDFAGGIIWVDELPAQDRKNPNIILKQWGSFCGANLEMDKDKDLPSIVRTLLLQRVIKWGRVLVVIDDFWPDLDGDNMRIIKKALPPNVPMLITTRQGTVIKGTVIMEDDIKKFDLGVLPRPESCQLLADLSDGKITPAAANEISELCGDMPLALKLIANLARIRSIDWLLEQLRVKRLDVINLDENSKKEQNIRISFDISYQALLDQHPEAAHIFRSLAVFARPTFIIFKHVANTLGNFRKQNEFLRLVDWSLLSEEKSIANNEMQYFHMHTLLHEYAQPLLTDPIEIGDAVKNHIRYCVDFANANPELKLQIHQKSTQEFEKSYGQLLQALQQIKNIYPIETIDWKNEPELARQVISLVETADHHWQLHSKFNDQDEWLQVAYACADALNDTHKQADFARRVSLAKSEKGNLKDARKWSKLSKTALDNKKKNQEENAIQAQLYIQDASINYRTSSLVRAEKNCMRGLQIVNEKGQPAIYAKAYNLLGVIKIRTNKLSAACDAFEKSLSAWQRVGDQRQIYRVEDNFRSALYYLGKIAALRKGEEEGLRYWEQFPDCVEYAAALTNLGLVRYIDQEYETAAELHEKAIKLSDSIGEPRLSALARGNLAWPYISLGKYDEAETLLNESIEIPKKHGIVEHAIDAERCLAEVEIGRKNYPKAIEIAKAVMQSAHDDEDSLEEGAALRVLGQAHYLNGDLQQAREYLEKSFPLLRDNEYRYESYLTLQALSQLYEDMGDIQKAKTATEDAQILSNEMGLHHAV